MQAKEGTCRTLCDEDEAETDVCALKNNRNSIMPTTQPSPTAQPMWTESLECPPKSRAQSIQFICTAQHSTQRSPSSPPISSRDAEQGAGHLPKILDAAWQIALRCHTDSHTDAERRHILGLTEAESEASLHTSIIYIKDAVPSHTFILHRTFSSTSNHQSTCRLRTTTAVRAVVRTSAE